MIILPAHPAGTCPSCAAPKIKPIYVHGEGTAYACAHYVCKPCSRRHGPGGRWHVSVEDAAAQPAPRTEAA
jgi:hypothetical protein